MSAILSNFRRSAPGGSNARLHHTGIVVLGTNGWSFSARCVKTPAFCLRRSSSLHHSTIFLRRESAAQVFSLLYQLSYSDFHRWQDSNLRPSTYEVTRAFTTPQTLQPFSLDPYLLISLFPHFFAFLLLCFLLPRTLVVCLRIRQFNPPKPFGCEIPGGIGAHGLSGLEPEAFRLLPDEVTVNFTIPGHLSRGE